MRKNLSEDTRIEHLSWEEEVSVAVERLSEQSGPRRKEWSTVNVTKSSSYMRTENHHWISDVEAAGEL